MKTLLAALGGAAILALTGCETTTTVVHKYEGPAQMGRGPCCPRYQCVQPTDRPMYGRGLGRGMGRGYGPGCRYWQAPQPQETPKPEIRPMPPRIEGPKPEAKAPGRGLGRGYQPTPDKPLPPWCPRNPKPEQKAPPKE